MCEIFDSVKAEGVFESKLTIIQKLLKNGIGSFEQVCDLLELSDEDKAIIRKELHLK